jgi:hypothetical protein
MQLHKELVSDFRLLKAPDTLTQPLILIWSIMLQIIPHPIAVTLHQPVKVYNVCIPDFDGVVTTARNNGFAIVADADAIDGDTDLLFASG